MRTPNAKSLQQHKSTPAFLLKTFQMLSNQSNAHIIHWHASGNYFIVQNPILLQNQLLPQFFKHSNFLSFVRQLNLYRFSKFKNQEQQLCFSHEHFIRNQKQTLNLISRKSKNYQQDFISDLEITEKINLSGLILNQKQIIDDFKLLKQQTDKLEEDLLQIQKTQQKIMNENEMLKLEAFNRTQQNSENIDKIMMLVSMMMQKNEVKNKENLFISPFYEGFCMQKTQSIENSGQSDDHNEDAYDGMFDRDDGIWKINCN